MIQYIFKRLLLMIPTVFGILLITFVIIQFVPGGPVEQWINHFKQQGQTGEVGAVVQQNIYRASTGLDQDKIKELKVLYGFDKPAYERFFMMVGNYLTFNLGNSYIHQKSVTELIIDKLPVSITLGMWTFLLTYLISIPLGIAKANHQGEPFDVGSTIIILIGSAIPTFVLGILLLVLFGGGSFWDVFPLRGLVSDHWDKLSFWDKVFDYLWHITLPVTAMVIGSFAFLTLLTKNSFIEEIRKQYVLTARAKGLSDTAVLYKHVFRNAMIPLATGFPSAFISAFFGASLLIENIFSLDGLGLLGYEALMKRDYPVILGTLYFFTLLSLIARLLSDISYVLIDPRIQFEAINQ